MLAALATIAWTLLHREWSMRESLLSIRSSKYVGVHLHNLTVRMLNSDSRIDRSRWRNVHAIVLGATNLSRYMRWHLHNLPVNSTSGKATYLDMLVALATIAWTLLHRERSMREALSVIQSSKYVGALDLNQYTVGDISRYVSSTGDDCMDTSSSRTVNAGGTLGHTVV